MQTWTGAQLAVKALEDEGVRLAFGIPGTHNIELYDALAASPLVRTVLVTDEQSAGFMADAVWRSTGQLACVNLVPGAGLTHALSGIAEAYLDGMALLVLGCGIRRDTGLGYQLHDVDQLAIARPVCKATFRPASGAHLYATVREACLLARSGTPGPVMVEVPVDQYLFKHAVDRFEAPVATRATLPDPGAFAQAAALLAEPGARPFLYLGWGAAAAGEALVALAEALGSPVATTITGKGVFPESHPLFLWNGFGRAAPPFVQAAVSDRTVTLAVGCRFSEVGTGSYSAPPPGTLIHADINREVFGRNYPAALTLEGDAAETVPALLAAVAATRRQPAPDLSFRTARTDVATHRRQRTSQAGVTPALLLEHLSRVFGPETIFTTDSGNGTFLAMECLTLDRPGHFLAPVDYSCMGYAVPAAIGAKLARPDKPVVALPGDGAFLMTGLELLTAASQTVPVAAFVLRDRELAQIAQFQRTAFNRAVASRLPDYHLGSVAEALGIEWFSLERDSDLTEAVTAAHQTVSAGRPVIVDVAIDYAEPTYFTKGVVRTNLARLPWKDRLRFLARALGRRL